MNIGELKKELKEAYKSVERFLAVESLHSMVERGRKKHKSFSC